MRYLLMLLLAFSLVACDPGAPGVRDNSSEEIENAEDDIEDDGEELEEDD